MSVINFPGATSEQNPEAVENIEEVDVTKTPDFSKDNNIYLEGVLNRMEAERNALAKTNNPTAIHLGNIISNLVNYTVESIKEELEKSPEMNQNVHAGFIIKECIDSVTAIFAGGVISPITGDDDEWLDVTDPADVGQNLTIPYRGTEYHIPIESVQVNIRYPKIYRFNNDNQYAHRLDYFQFHNIVNQDQVHRTEDSLRFIQFPYSMTSVHVQCIMMDNQITDYIEFTPDDISNGLVYPDSNNAHPESFIVAPRIPFTMLEAAGINLDTEIHEYIDSVMTAHNDTDEEDECDFDFDDEEVNNDE